MPDSGSPPPKGPGSGRRRVALLVCCLVAVTAGGLLVATVGSSGLAGSPIDSVLPGEDISENRAANGDSPFDSGEAIGGERGGLGSLTPGAQTGIGGDPGLDNDTFASLDTEVHFVAESSDPTYWRTAAYDTYTGDGWTRDADTEPYDPPLRDSGFDRVSYNVTLRQPAGALPTPWQPDTISGIDEGELGVTPEGSIQTDDQLPEGTSFTGVSRGPEDSPGLLQGVDGSHPSELDRYTQLPDDIAPRVEAQTSNIIGDADSRYEAAVAVQSWLQGDKEYSLEAFRSTDNIAETFIFEMEAGYCEYFATAMATMLRTQDIPTRYAIGYSSGQAIGDDRYQVRAMNAHAWVEVYFEGVGWVQFDPTPAGERLGAQQESLADIGEEYNVTEPTNPGETITPEDLDGEDETDGEGWAVETDRTPVPGEAVELTVTFDGDPIPDLEVVVNGEPVGATDGDGRVTTTVPDTDSFEISVFLPPVERGTPTDERDGFEVRQPTDGRDDMERNQSVTSGATTLPGGALASGVAADTPPGDDPGPDAGVGNLTDELYNETVNVVTEADIEISGEVVPGNEIGVTVLLGGDTLSETAVFVDGQQVGVTDGAGWATFRLPESPGTVEIAVERDPVAGERAVDVPPLAVSATPDWPVAVPFAPATVEASYGDEPAVGVPVEVDGEQVTATGTDGGATVRLPVGRSADIAAVQNGVRAETGIGGLLVNLLLVVGPVGGVFAGGLYLLVRIRGRPGADPGPLGRLVAAGRQAVRRVHRFATRTLVAGAGRGDSALARAGASIRETVRLVLAAVGLWAVDSSAGTPDSRVTVAEDGEVSPDQRRVRAAWGRFLACVSAPAATHTPGELAAHAVERDGLPAEPVGTLRDAFRAVEYGDRSVELDQVEAALAAIEAAATDDGRDKR